jgi:serine protease DegS
MFKALRFFGWPLLTGVLIALLIIQHYPQLVGLPTQDVNLQQAPQTTRIQQGPVSYAGSGQPVYDQDGQQNQQALV